MIWRYLILSLLIHWSLVLLLNSSSPPLSPSSPVEITIVDQPAVSEHRHRSFLVRPSPNLPTLNQLKPLWTQDPLLSDKDRYVTKETLAPSKSSEAGEKKENKSLNFPPKPDGLFPKESNKSQLAGGTEWIPTVATGPITSLNTERFTYYTFFARIEDKIKPLWERNLKEIWLHLSDAQRKKLESGSSVSTSLEVILSPEGDYRGSFLRDSSGFISIDEAPVEAFKSAQSFPNPPKAMIKPDNLIHLDYVFIIH